PNSLSFISSNTTEIKIYPIPANEYFTLLTHIESATNFKVDVYNLAGIFVQSLYQQPISQGKHTLKFSTDNLNSGNYLLRIMEGKHVYVRKLFIYK
ncbi:MAG: T9SS type A sorting domain-containing protein, partial [Ignavibacteria bacterium]|nr:T9SS type A sorting domain-containing protein [Ignavibacteria bacterium]